MAKGLIEQENLTNIANAIRSKNGTTNQYTPSEMASAINNISTNTSVIKPTELTFRDSEESSMDLSCLDTSNMTDMSYMFYRCNNLENLDLSNFNTSNVTDMRYMFYQCSKFNYDLSNFDTSKVTNMSSMFYNISGLDSLDLRNFDFSNVKYANDMFAKCSMLSYLDISTFDFNHTLYANRMFENCGSGKYSQPGTTVYVKDEVAQQWVLNSNGVPESWSTQNVIIKNSTNLLTINSQTVDSNDFTGEEGVIMVQANTIVLTSTGAGAFGLTISQPNLTLSANKTYIFSCSNILEGTQISINNENDKMLNGSKGLVQFTPSSDILNPQIIVWVNEGVVYNHTELAIKLEER